MIPMQVAVISQTQIKLMRDTKSIVVNCGIDEFMERYTRWDQGELIQNAFDNLTAGEREFILTGITDEEWDDMFPDNSF